MHICNKGSKHLTRTNIDFIKSKLLDKNSHSDLKQETSNEFIQEIGDEINLNREEISDVLDYIRHENILGHEELAIKLWNNNGGRAFENTRTGEVSTMFEGLEKEFGYVGAHNIKSELFKNSVVREIGNWTDPDLSTVLIEKELINEQGEPIIKIQGGIPYFINKNGQALAVEGFDDIDYEAIANDIIASGNEEGDNVFNPYKTELIDRESQLKDSILFVDLGRKIDALDIQMIKENIITELLGLEVYDANTIEDLKDFYFRNLRYVQEKILSSDDVDANREYLRDQRYFTFLHENFDRLLEEIVRENNFLFEFNKIKTDSEGSRVFGNVYDQDQLSINPIDRAGIATMKVFYGLKKHRDDDYFFYETLNPRKIQNEIIYLLSTVEPDFDKQYKAIENLWNDNKSKGYLLDVLGRMEELAPHHKNMFVQDMDNAYHDLVYVWYARNKDSGIKLEVRRASNLHLDLVDTWGGKLMNSDLFIPIQGGSELILDMEAVGIMEQKYYKARADVDGINELIKLNEVEKLVAYSDELEKMGRQLFNRKVGIYADVFELIGMDISSPHIIEMLSGYYVVDKKNTRFGYKHIFGGIGVGKIFQDIFAIRDLKSEHEALKVSSSYRELFNPIVYTIASREVPYSDIIPNSGTLIAGKIMYPYSLSFLWNDIFLKLKSDQEQTRLKSSSSYYSKNSSWLKSGQVNDLKLLSLSPGVFSGYGRNSDKKLNQLSYKDDTIVRLGLFINSGFQRFKNSTKHRTAVVLYTPSNSSKFFAVEHEAPEIKHIFNANVFDFVPARVDSTVSSTMLETLFDNLIAGELNRIVNYYSSEDMSEDKSYNESGGTFIQFPELNDLRVNINEGRDKSGQYMRVIDYLKNIKTIDGEFIFPQGYKKIIKEVVINYLENYIVDRRKKVGQEWMAAGIIKNNGMEISFDILDDIFFTEFKEEINNLYLNRQGRGRKMELESNQNRDIRNVLTYYVVTNLLAEANINQLVLGDPVFFAKTKSGQTNIENGIMTSFNLLKRSRLFNTTRQRTNQSGNEQKERGYLLISEPIEDVDNIEFYKEVSGAEHIRYKNIEVLDASEFITVGTALFYEYQNANITEQKYNEELRHYKQNGELKDKTLRLGFSKRVYTGRKWSDELKTYIHYYIKSGTTALYPGVYPKQWDEVIKNLEALEADVLNPDQIHIIPPSALKVGQPSYFTQPLFKEDGGANEKLFSEVQKGKLITLSTDQNGLQIREPNKDLEQGQTTIKLSTQFKQFVFLHMLEKSKTFSYKGRDINGLNLFKKYEEVIAKIYEFKANKFLDNAGIDEDWEIKDKRVFARKIQKILDNSYANQNMEDIAEVMFEIDQATGTFIEPLGYTKSKKIQSVIMSLLQKEFLDYKLPGNSLYVSPHHNLRYDDPGSSRIIWIEEKEVQELTGPTREDPSADVLVASKLTDNEGNLIDLMQTGDDGEFIWIDKTKNGYVLKPESVISRSIFNTVAYRGPTADLSYMVDINIVGFLPPNMGNQIVTLKDIIPKTGHDNDGDKLTVLIQHHRIVDGKIEIDNRDVKGALIKLGRGDEASVDYEVGTDRIDIVNYRADNDMIQIFKSILSSTDLEVQKLIFNPVDSSYIGDQAQAFKQIRTELELSRNKTGLSYINILGEMYQTKLRRDNSQTNSGTSFYASISNFLSQVYFTEKYLGRPLPWFIERSGRYSNIELEIAGSKTNGDVSVTAQTFQYNAKSLSNAVDDSMHQFMKDMNDNNFTYNARFAMLMFGMTNEVVVDNSGKKLKTDAINLLMNQPILFRYISKLQYNNSDVVIKRTKKIDIIKEMFNEVVIKDMFSDIDEVTNLDFKWLSFNKASTILKGLTPQQLFNNIKSGNLFYGKSDLAVIIMYEALTSIGKDMSAINKKISIDRNGIGINFIEGFKASGNLRLLQEFKLFGDAQFLLYKTEVNLGEISSILKQANYFPGIGHHYMINAYEAIISKGLNTIYNHRLYPEISRAYDGLRGVSREVGSLYDDSVDLGPDLISFMQINTSKIIDIDLAGEDIEYDRNALKKMQARMSFDKGVQSMSLASYIQTLKQKYPIFQDNKFLAQLKTNIKTWPENSTVIIDMTQTDARSRQEMRLAIDDMIFNPELLPMPYQGKQITTKDLIDLIHIYSIIGNAKKWGSDFSEIIPIAIREKISDIRVNRNIDDSMDKIFINRFVYQRLQHNPRDAEKIYYTLKDMEKDGVIMLDRYEKPVTEIARAVKIKAWSDDKQKLVVPYRSIAVKNVSAPGPSGYYLFVQDSYGLELSDLISVHVLGSKDMTEFDPNSKKFWADSVYYGFRKKAQPKSLIRTGIEFKEDVVKLELKVELEDVLEKIGRVGMLEIKARFSEDKNKELKGSPNLLLNELEKDRPDVNILFELITGKYRAYRTDVFNLVLNSWDVKLDRVMRMYNVIIEKTDESGRDFVQSKVLNPGIDKVIDVINDLETKYKETTRFILNYENRFNILYDGSLDQFSNLSKLASMKKVLEVFNELGNVEDIELFIQNNFPRSEVAQRYRDRWEVLKKFIPTLKDVYYKYSYIDRPQAIGNYDEGKISISLVAIMSGIMADEKYKSFQNVRSAITYTLLHELDHHFYYEVIDEILKKSYDVDYKDYGLEIYTKKPGVVSDPDIELLIELTNLFKSKTALSGMTEAKMMSFLKGNKDPGVHRSLSVTEMMAMTYSMSDDLNDMNKYREHLDNFPRVRQYLKDNYGASAVDIVSDVLKRLTPFERLGLTSDGRVRTDRHNDDKKNCK